MTTLITGGTGFIGSRMALRLRRSGVPVRILAQRNTPAERQNLQELEAAGAEILEGSVTDPAAVVRASVEVDTVYHFAAAQHEANVPPQHYHHVNVEGTRQVLDAAHAAGVRRFVHGSTIGVFGRNGSDVISEHSPLQPENLYGVTKLAAEDVVRNYMTKLDCVVVRISETYGPGDRRLLKLFKALKSGRFFHIGREQNLHHPVYIDDLLDGLQLAASQPAAPGGTFILPGPRALTTQEMIDTIARALRVTPSKLRLPLAPLRAIAVTMEKTLGPLGIQPPLHRRRLDFFVRSFRFTDDRAHLLLGYQPSIDFDEGARRTAAWYREAGLIPSGSSLAP
jgi:dihydroflavonol-4-reductase